MAGEIKNMAYWRAKNALPGINPDSEGNTNLPDGRSGSSPLQQGGYRGSFGAGPLPVIKSLWSKAKKGVGRLWRKTSPETYPFKPKNN